LFAFFRCPDELCLVLGQLTAHFDSSLPLELLSLHKSVDGVFDLKRFHRLFELLGLVSDEGLLVDLKLAFLAKLSISLFFESNLSSSFFLELLKLHVSFGSLGFFSFASLFFDFVFLRDEVFHVGSVPISLL
jgi:hypothetical protein